MFLRALRIAAVVGGLLLTGPTQAQSIATAAEVVQAMGFAEDYESYVYLTVEGMTDTGLIGGTAKDVTKLQGEVRQYLLDERAQVSSMLALSLDQNRSISELQILKSILEQGVTLNDLPGQVSYSLKAEIYSTMSAYALVVAMGRGS